MSTDWKRRAPEVTEKTLPPKYARKDSSAQIRTTPAGEKPAGDEPIDQSLGTSGAFERQATGPATTPAVKEGPVSAIFVTHGMGAQLRFQPMDGIAHGMDRVVPALKREVHTVPVDGAPPIQRLQLSDGTRTLHIYEAYWAPLTEGQVGLTDVIRFLWNGGWNGFTKANRKFYRNIFQNSVGFDIPFASNILVIIVALAIISLVGIVLLGSAVLLKGVLSVEAQSTRDVMTLIAIFVHQVMAFGVFLVVAHAARPSAKSGSFHRFVAHYISAIGTLALYVATAALLLAAWGIGVILAASQAVTVPPTAAVIPGCIQTLHAAFPVGLWILLGFIAALALIEPFVPGLPNFLQAIARFIRWLTVAGIVAASAVLLFQGSVKLYAQGKDHFELRCPTPVRCDERPSTCKEDLHSLWMTVFIKRNVAASLDRCPYTANSWWPVLVFMTAGALLTAVRRVTSGIRDRGRHPSGWFGAIELLAFGVALLSLPLLTFRVVFWVVQSWIKYMGMPEGRSQVYLPWVLVVAIGYLVRSFLVSYLGDVVAYVSSHKLDRFFKIKDEIRTVALNVARALYLSKKPDGSPLYQNVGFVSHSLGTVVAYDALNRMLIEEQLDLSAPSKNYNVRERTNLFITSGSPLDKIAYVYGTSSSSVSAAIDELSAATQPLISDAAFRTDLKWINYWSPSDIISGPLDFYDNPDIAMPPRVKNVEDKNATTPLAAHSEYFENDAIFEEINHWWK